MYMLEIMGYSFKVHFTKNKKLLGENSEGAVDVEKKNIYIDKRVDSERIFSILMHEAGEGIGELLTLKLTGDTENSDDPIHKEFSQLMENVAGVLLANGFVDADAIVKEIKGE